MDNESDYKFWNQGNKDIHNVISGNLRYVFMEVKECFKSLNIELSHDDILRAYDMFLRFNGFMPDPSSREDKNNPHGINCIVYPSNVSDPKEFIDEGTLNSNVYIIGLRVMNDILPEKSKFEDLDTVTKNVNEIFHQFSILTNDIIKKVCNIHNTISLSGKFDSYQAIYSCNMDWNTNYGILFSICQNAVYDKSYVIQVKSSILGPIKDDCYVVVESFPNEDRDSIRSKINDITEQPTNKRMTGSDIINFRFKGNKPQ